MKKVSVIIPAYNAERHLSRVLNALNEQNYKEFEVIVVNDNSKDETSKIVKKFKRFKLIENKSNLGLSKSMNKGISEASGEIIITLHDDCVPLSKNWILGMVKTFEANPKIGIVSSDYVINFRKLGLIDKCFSYAYWLGSDIDIAKKDGIEEVDLISDKCDAYKLEVLRKIGLFDEKFRFANEDIDVSKKVRKLGYKIVKNYECKVEHIFAESERERTILDHFKKAFQITEDNIHVFLRYGVKYKIDSLLFILSSIICYILPSLILPFYILSVPLHKFFAIFGIFAFGIVYYMQLGLINQPWLALIIGVSYLLAKNFYKGLNYFKNYEKFDLVIPITLFCFLWDMAAGIGWVRSILKFVMKD